jgi:hypothetical protein
MNLEKQEILAILMFGSMWGFLQSILTWGMVKFELIPFFFANLHACPCPLSAVLFGIPLMGAGFAIYKKPSMLMGMGLVASLFSFLVIPFLNVPAFTQPITTYPIVNPALANFLSSLTFYLALSLVGKKRETMSTPSLAGIGGLSMLLSSIIWIYTVVSIGAPILKASSLSRPLAYVVKVSPIWAVLSTLTLPIGYLIGPRIQPKLQYLSKIRPLLYRTSLIFLLIICWGISLVASVILAT